MCWVVWIMVFRPDASAMIVYRIVREKFRHDALSAEGSRRYGGRWNPKGTGVLYTTSTPELGLVETLAHAPEVRYEDLPAYWLSQIEIPDSLRTFRVDEMPDFWQDKTYDRTQLWLKDWLKNPGALAVAVPSVIVPFSQNIIIHTNHTLFAQVRLLDQQPLRIDNRLWRK